MDYEHQQKLVEKLAALGFEGYADRILEQFSSVAYVLLLTDKIFEIQNAPNNDLRLNPDEMINMLRFGKDSILFCNAWLTNGPALLELGFTKQSSLEILSHCRGYLQVNALVEYAPKLFELGFNPDEIVRMVNKKLTVDCLRTLVKKNQLLREQGLTHDEVVKLFSFKQGVRISTIILHVLVSFEQAKSARKTALLELLGQQSNSISGSQFELLWREQNPLLIQENMTRNTLFAGKKRSRDESFTEEEEAAISTLASLKDQPIGDVTVLITHP